MGRVGAVALLVIAVLAGCAKPSPPEAAPVNLVIGKSPPQDAEAPSPFDEDRLVKDEPYVPLPGATASPFSGPCPPFDRGAAAAALGSVNMSSCKRAGGPTGTGHLRITYAPSGQVQSAVVDGGPFVNTPVGGCIASLFRNATVPAFCGTSITLGKSFNLP